MRIGKIMLVIGGVALVAGAGFATAASAQDQKTPKSWSYEIKDGKRVPKGNRVTNADGSAQVRDCKDLPGTGLPDCKINVRPKGSFTDIK
jgi:hypothetical protein